MRFELFNTVLGLLAASLAACSTPQNCETLGKCGGDFLGGAKDLGAGVAATEWVATTVDACIDQVPNPPSPASLTLIPPRPAGVRAVEPATVDWCNGLVLSGDGTIKDYSDGWYETLKQFSGWFPSVPLYTAQLEFQQNYQYALSTTQLVRQHANLPPPCLVAQGVKMTCDRLSTELQSFLEARFNTVGGLKAVVYGNTCLPTVEGGCSCDYNVSLTNTTAGPWNAEEGQVAFFDFTAAPPAQADYCVGASGLLLSGTDGTDLFNRSALKTLQLKPPSCTDGTQSKTLGETGVDCGGTCPNACPQ